MNDSQKLVELAETAECLMMLGQAMREHAKHGRLAESILCLKATHAAAPELVRECASKIGIELVTPLVV